MRISTVAVSASVFACVWRSWPGVVKPGTRSQALIQNIDYAPTFLEAAGVEIPADIQGRSLLPVLKNQGIAPAGWRKAIYYFYSGEATHRVAAHNGVRTDRYKLFHLPDTDEWQLFDLETDSGEQNDLALRVFLLGKERCP